MKKGIKKFFLVALLRSNGTVKNAEVIFNRISKGHSSDI